MERSILAILTSRSQYARVKTLYQSLSNRNEVKFDLIVAGGGLVHKYGDLTAELHDAGLEPTKTINTLVEGGTPVTQAKTTGMSLLEYATTIDDLNPDVVITTGDRYETMATTIAATYLNIPIAHLEGGELTGSIDDKVRHATTKMADYHFVSTDRSARIVRSPGESPDRIYNTGCPSIDLCQSIKNERRSDYDPQIEHGGVGDRIDVSDDYIVVQYHPLPTDYKSNFEKVQQLIQAFEKVDTQAVWFWPNMDAGTDQVSQAIRNYRETHNPEGVRFFINLPPSDYLTLVNNTACFVGNSSVGIRECSYLGVPSVNIGGRQNNRERSANVMDVHCDSVEISKAIKKQIHHGSYGCSTLYGKADAAQRITDTILSLDLKRKPPMNPELIIGSNKVER